jgi:uncharacterized protein YecA (UPF0149 family)
MMEYARPLLAETDGSVDQMNKALTLAQLCWNLALTPEEERGDMLADMRPTLKMDDGEFEQFRSSVILPMIRRHIEMFPNMPRLESRNHSKSGAKPQMHPTIPLPKAKHGGTGRNEPCPCNSGKKYKKCCGR